MRLCKTRTQGAELCKKGRVLVGGTAVKPSFTVTEGLTVQLRVPPAVFTYRVLQLSGGRLGAKDVPSYMIDLTPPDQAALLKAARDASFAGRDRGAGRPTKKERRDLDDFYDETFYDSDHDPE